MDSIFESLIENTITEISRREPNYLSRFPLSFQSMDVQLEHYLGSPLMQGYSEAQISEALARGRNRLTGRGLLSEHDADEADPIALVVSDSIVDAFAAEQGRLALRPHSWLGSDLTQSLNEMYDHRETGNGRRYLIRRQGSRPLLLINAIGIPLAIWSTFLTDPMHDFRIIVVESRTTDLMSGGVQQNVDLDVDTDDIVAALRHEAIDTIHVLGWSNGARVAINLASTHPGIVKSLILLSPTLSGTRGIPPNRDTFEETLREVSIALHANAALANSFVKLLGERSCTPDWARIASNPRKRAEILFGMPAGECASMLVAPMAHEDHLLNYGERIVTDLTYLMDESLARLQIPIFLITGQNDNVISNKFACTALSTFTKAVTHANVQGAGHYINDLQYPYFRWLLDSYCIDGNPMSALRVGVRAVTS